MDESAQEEVTQENPTTEVDPAASNDEAGENEADPADSE